MFLQILVHKSSQSAYIPAFIYGLKIGTVLQEVYYEKDMPLHLLYNFDC